MHNRSDQEIGQVTQRPSGLVDEPLPAGVGRLLGRQAGQKTLKRLGPVALQGEYVLELIYDAFDDLPLSRRPARVAFLEQRVRRRKRVAQAVASASFLRVSMDVSFHNARPCLAS